MISQQRAYGNIKVITKHKFQLNFGYILFGGRKGGRVFSLDIGSKKIALNFCKSHFRLHFSENI